MKLQNKKIIGIIFLITILTSCKSEIKNKLTEKTFPVVIEEYSKDELHQSDTTTLTIRKNDSINFHLFGLNSDGEYEIHTDLPFEINSNDKSKILINKIPAKLISKKQYAEKNKKLLVRKYFYERENAKEKTGNYFVLNNRIIAFHSTTRNLYRFYKYENSEIEKLLEKDTTEFFNHRNKITTE
ncbi:MAG: hypothetical protein QM495_11545 [Lutibacter sp.]|uniref:hypothetical protein n=1 Tax=Lutibacter sp. TaxID=1925666 RepID=UPI00385E2AF6